ncbi:MAG TPA: hypothetical protein VGE77_09995 [Nocardioides sp.]
MPSLPSRRTVLRSAAWSVPAVTVVAAAPAHASSTGTTSSIAVRGGSLTRDWSGGWTLEVFLALTPVPTTRPALQFSVDGAHLQPFDSVNARNDWGQGVYQCHFWNLGGAFTDGATVPVAFFAPGYTTGAGLLDVMDMGGGIPGDGGWGDI